MRKVLLEINVFMFYWWNFFISQIYMHWNPTIAQFMGLKFISYCKVKFKTIPKTV